MGAGEILDGLADRNEVSLDRSLTLLVVEVGFSVSAFVHVTIIAMRRRAWYTISAGVTLLRRSEDIDEIGLYPTLQCFGVFETSARDHVDRAA